MKITTDLRVAIRAVCKNQPPISRDIIQKREDEAVAAMLKKNPAAMRALARAKKLHTALTETERELEKFGLTRSGEISAYRANGAFERAGGKLPERTSRPDYETILYRLSVADDKQGAAILKELGIKW